MKQEYTPNYTYCKQANALRLNLRKAIREKLDAILAIVKGASFEIETETLWDVMQESAYVSVIVNDSGEYTYLRNEKVRGLRRIAKEERDVIPENAVSVITETGTTIDTDELDTDQLVDVYALANEVLQRLRSGDFAHDANIVYALEE